MPFVQADIDALDAAYKSGALSVQTADGRRVGYRSVEEYRALRSVMAQDILGAGNAASRMVRVGFSSGVR